MDLCTLYGATNGPLLSKMIGNIFTQQPKYQNDLVEVVPTILQVKCMLLMWLKFFCNSAPKKKPTRKPSSRMCTVHLLTDAMPGVGWVDYSAPPHPRWVLIYPTPNRMTDKRLRKHYLLLRTVKNGKE